MSAPDRQGFAAVLRKRNGFALIELVFVVAIVAILALFALPSYSAAGNRARRAEGKILLQSVIAAEENYYATFNHYTAQTGGDGIATDVTSKPRGYYRLAALTVSTDGQTVSAVAEPQYAQIGDPCGSLGLDSRGRRTAAGEDCW